MRRLCHHAALRPSRPFRCIDYLSSLKLGKLEEAEELFTAALEIRERVLGSVHLDTAASLSDMTMLQVDQGRLLEAEPLFRRWACCLVSVLPCGHRGRHLTAASAHGAVSTAWTF